MASLSSETLAAMRLTKVESENEIAAEIAKTSHGYFFPDGAKLMIA